MGITGMSSCHLLSKMTPDVVKKLQMKQKEKSFLRTRRVIVIAGPTGVGKTSISLLLAKILGGEIVNADSMNVYKGMDVGTAKVSREDREKIPHHLIDICDIDEPFNVCDFCAKANSLIEMILARGSVPIIVGGTGFYLHHLIYGAPSGPPSDISVRVRLEQEGREKGYEELYKRLISYDPIYAKTITANDKHKIVRALEIIAISGKSVTSFSSNKKKIEPFTYDYRCWFLDMDREVLRNRLSLRCEDMISSGLLQEVSLLISHGLLENQTAKSAIGYKQAIAYLQGPKTEKTYKEFIEKFKNASFQLAKRQRTWFRKEPLFRWLDISTMPEEYVLDLLASDYASPTPLSPPPGPQLPFAT